MKKDLSVVANGLEFLNPFIIGSGPPGTNKSTIRKAFTEGWGGVVAKTISLNPSKIHNVAPRYGKLKSRISGEIIGFENIELISDRELDDWLDDFAIIKREFPDHILIASIMEEYDENSWKELIAMCEEAGVDAFELNLSCPHGLPERQMGAAMGQNPEIVKQVCLWSRKATKKPIWAKMTPNITDITVPSEMALQGGADGIALINTILSIIGVDLKTLSPLPSVKGYSTPGGYSAYAIKPIALRMVMEVAKKIQEMNYKKASISGMGGIETSHDAIEFILLGADTVQACTGPMLKGHKMVKELIQGLENFMEEHEFKRVHEFKGKSLQYITTHSHLCELKKGSFTSSEIAKDAEWSGDNIISQTENMIS